MADHTLNEALAVIETCRNFMAGMSSDPTIPAHAKEALCKKVDTLDSYISDVLGEEND